MVHSSRTWRLKGYEGNPDFFEFSVDKRPLDFFVRAVKDIPRNYFGSRVTNRALSHIGKTVGVPPPSQKKFYANDPLNDSFSVLFDLTRELDRRKSPYRKGCLNCNDLQRHKRQPRDSGNALANRSSEIGGQKEANIDQSPKTPARQNGYTLTELLVVLAIMGLMAALAPPLLTGTHRNFQTKSEVYHFAGQLEAAHQEAVDTQTTVQVQLPSQDPATFFADGSATGISFHWSHMTISVLPISGSVIVSDK